MPDGDMSTKNGYGYINVYDTNKNSIKSNNDISL